MLFLAVYGGLFSTHMYKKELQTMKIHLKADVCLLHGFYNPQKGHSSTHFPCGGHSAVQHGILGTSWAHSGWDLGVSNLGDSGFEFGLDEEHVEKPFTENFSTIPPFPSGSAVYGALLMSKPLSPHLWVQRNCWVFGALS